MATNKYIRAEHLLTKTQKTALENKANLKKKFKTPSASEVVRMALTKIGIK